MKTRSSARPRRILSRGDEAVAVRTYPQIAEILAARGIRISPVRVQQICRGAEKKLLRRLRSEGAVEDFSA